MVSISAKSLLLGFFFLSNTLSFNILLSSPQGKELISLSFSCSRFQFHYCKAFHVSKSMDFDVVLTAFSSFALHFSFYSNPQPRHLAIYNRNILFICLLSNLTPYLTFCGIEQCLYGDNFLLS